MHYYILNEDYEITYKKKIINKSENYFFMKLLITCLTLFVLCSTISHAQPSNENVISYFKKNGVTSVKVIKTVKEWDSKELKYYWKVSLVKTQPVPPAEVDGLTGVTLETHVVADYDLGSQSPYWSGVTFSEYKGINLPTPTKEEFTAMLEKAAAVSPDNFFRSSSGKVSLDKVWVDDPQSEWINPKKLTFKGWMIFKEEVSYTEIGEIQAPIEVTLVRPTIKGEWVLDYVYQYVESQTELRRINKNAAGTDAMSMADRAVENTNKTDAQKHNTPTPPQYTTAEALANDFITMLHNLTREQMDYYIIQMFSPEFRCTGCSFTPNSNGLNRDNYILEKAYDGSIKFREAYCMNPKLNISNDVAYIKDKSGNYESSIVMDKVGQYYYLNSADIRIGNDAGVKNMSCDNSSSSVNATTGNILENIAIPGNKWKKGDKVMVEENGTWYKAEILDAKPGNKYYIHYEGYASSYDLWVNKDRVKDR
jgi:hypothetical protein